MHELAVADVDADVRVLLAFLVEEDEGRRGAARDLDAMATARWSSVLRGSLRPGLRVAPLHQAAAVEAGRGAGAPVAIGLADELRGVLRGAIADAAPLARRAAGRSRTPLRRRKIGRSGGRWTIFSPASQRLRSARKLCLVPDPLAAPGHAAAKEARATMSQ
jgi:hypothetical protein